MSHCHASKPIPDEVGDPPLQNELGDAGGGQWENGSWWHHNEGCIGKRKKAELENDPRTFQCHLWNNVTLLLTGVYSGGCKCYRKHSDRNASSRTDMLVSLTEKGVVSALFITFLSVLFQNVSPQRNVPPPRSHPDLWPLTLWPQHTRMHTPSAVQGETTPLYGLRYIQMTFVSTTVPAHETPLVC